MKIDNSGSAISAYAGQNKLAKRDAASKTSTAATAPTDSVEINPFASSLSAVAQQSGESSFDAAKVASIKSAIASGNFSVNPEKIADSLIASARELLGQ
ncbi:flagellar biosynthesis anti-sigma factor FlgM [uncultured Aquitalea sp.]|uniref:flagellar biosynthesis anti-sigma factor FlgM n=1 Tax=uncultured Aquitalea sp. TaxID=540272 RepID=UPI0025D57604|nr:flagellar biosynthesis anti-sigma factor FlgM [uncultured Aquitalea sp.]